MTKKHFSKIGLAYMIGTLLVLGFQYLAEFLIVKFLPRVYDNSTLNFLLVMLSMYAVSMPLMGFIISRIPAEGSCESQEMTFGRWFKIFVIAYAGMYITNLIGNFITQIISIFKGSAVSNDLMEIISSNDSWCNFLVIVIFAPIAEELLFRKLLIDRTIKYGQGISILTSALFFGLFHGNLNQFVYAFTIGAVFAYVYSKTGKIHYTILMHMLINFLGSVVSMLIFKWSGFLEIANIDSTDTAAVMEIMSNHIGGIILLILYFVALLAMVITGIVLFCVNVKKIKLEKTEYTIEKGKRFTTYFVNIGMIAFAIYWIVMIVIQLLR